MPLPNRAKRLEESTKEMENLYLRHAAKDSSNTGHRNAAIQPDSSRSSVQNHRADIEPKDLGGVPLSRNILDRPADYELRPRDYASLDARRFAARPPATQENVRHGAEETPSSQQNTTGLFSRQRYPTRQSGNGGENDQRPERRLLARHSEYPRQDPRGPAYPDKNPGARNAYPMRQGTRNEMPSRMTRESDQYSSNTGRREHVQSSRPRQSRASRGEGSRETRRRKGDRQPEAQTEFAGGASEKIWSEEEEEYLKQKRKKDAARSIEYNPGDLSSQTFSGIGPAVASGERGMNEVLGEKLRLAWRYRKGDFIEWNSKEQKADVMTLVERFGHEDEPEGESSSLSGEAERQTQALMQKLLGGAYEFTGPKEGKDILGTVARYADRNESYFPVDQNSLLKKVESLMPSKDAKRNLKTATSEPER